MERRRLQQQKLKERTRLYRSEENLSLQHSEQFQHRFLQLRRLEDDLNRALASLLFLSSTVNPSDRTSASFSSSQAMMSDARCANCQFFIAPDEQIVNADGQIWHMQCFV